MAVSDTLRKAAHAVGAHRISTRPFSGHVGVERDGRVLAGSDRAVALYETGLPTRFYLPRDDVRVDLLAPSETTSHCPFKGDATYFSAPEARDAFWVYESPSQEKASPIAGMLAPLARSRRRHRWRQADLTITAQPGPREPVHAQGA